MYDYKLLEHDLTSVANYFSERHKDDERFDEVLQLIAEHGEYGEAYHLLCYLVEEKGLLFPHDLYQRIVRLGEQMGLQEQSWLSLSQLGRGPAAEK